jgi:hypothetical protein
MLSIDHSSKLGYICIGILMKRDFDFIFLFFFEKHQNWILIQFFNITPYFIHTRTHYFCNFKHIHRSGYNRQPFLLFLSRFNQLVIILIFFLLSHYNCHMLLAFKVFQELFRFIIVYFKHSRNHKYFLDVLL